MRRFTKRLLSLTTAVSLIVGAMSLLAPTKVMAAELLGAPSKEVWSEWAQGSSFFSAVPKDDENLSAYVISAQDPQSNRDIKDSKFSSASATYYANKIVVKDAAGKKLVAQWSQGDKDYGFVKTIEDNDVTIYTKDITKNPDLKFSRDCKVWLEYYDSTMLSIYAKMANYSKTSLSDATVSASVSPVYSGLAIDGDNFKIDVTLEDSTEPVDPENYELKFYSDENCTNEIKSITDAGVYYVKAFGLEAKEYCDSAGQTRVKVLKAQIAKPEAVKGLVEDGTEKIGVQLPDGANPNLYVIENGKATNAGTYEAKISLSDPKNYCWVGEDNDPESSDSSKPFNIQWMIEPPHSQARS